MLALFLLVGIASGVFSSRPPALQCFLGFEETPLKLPGRRGMALSALPMSAFCPRLVVSGHITPVDSGIVSLFAQHVEVV